MRSTMRGVFISLEEVTGPAETTLFAARHQRLELDCLDSRIDKSTLGC